MERDKAMYQRKYFCSKQKSVFELISQYLNKKKDKVKYMQILCCGVFTECNKQDVYMLLLLFPFKI